jgi:hypothetical protein
VKAKDQSRIIYTQNNQIDEDLHQLVYLSVFPIDCQRTTEFDAAGSGSSS